MLRMILLSVFAGLILCSSPAFAQQDSTLTTDKTSDGDNILGPSFTTTPITGSDQLYSPIVSRKFYEIAYDLANPDDVIGQELDVAIVFLTAAMKLDRDNKDALPLLIKFATRNLEYDYSNLVYNLLNEYVDENADLGIVRKAISYLLERLNSREDREKFLEQILQTIGSKNVILSSDIATLLGLLKVEKADIQSAQRYLIQAYRSNRYNRQAFENLNKIAPQQIAPATYLERLRLALRVDPSEMDNAILFAQNAEMLELYDVSAAAYKYCADLFTYLYPSEVLPARIYIPWALSCYNSNQYVADCLNIAKRVRREGRFDLRIEAIVGKAAIKMQDGQLATNTLQTAEKEAKKLAQEVQTIPPEQASESQNKIRQERAEQLAWFYCFALPNPKNAVFWANEAFSIEPNSPVAASLLAYALTSDNQAEWATHLIENFPPNQILTLTKAQIELAQGKTESSIELLKKAVSYDSGSFAAERAKDILANEGQSYEPPVDPRSVLAMLRSVFGQMLVPNFAPPDKIMSVQLKLPGNELAYGTEITGSIAITNNSPEPLIINDNSMFMGFIRIDAKISGDLDLQIPNLISEKIRTVFLIEPGGSMLVPLRLSTGQLQRTLDTYPQATLEIEFTLYLDPVVMGNEVAQRLTYLEPVHASIKRKGVELSDSYLRNRFNSLTTGQLAQKIQTARLFVGLLLEQYAMSDRRPPYNFMYADWIAPLLRSALLHESGLLRSTGPDEWIVKVYTLADMLPLPLDIELITAVSESLNSDKWPARLMAVYLLAQSPQSRFGKVLEWLSKYDQNREVKNMANVMLEFPAPE